MHVNRSYKNAQTARVVLQRELNRAGFKLSDVQYEIKRIGNRFHPVVHENSGGAVCRILSAGGIIVTH